MKQQDHLHLREQRDPLEHMFKVGAKNMICSGLKRTCLQYQKTFNHESFLLVYFHIVISYHLEFLNDGLSYQSFPILTSPEI